MRFRRARPDDPPRPQRSTRGRMLITMLAGATTVFAFAPFGWWPLQIVALAILFYQVLRGADNGAGTRHAIRSPALIGWAYGFGATAAGTHWLYISLHRYGDMAAPMAVAAVLLLAFGMGFYVALAMGGAAWLRRRWLLPLPLVNLMVLPVMWALFEWVRSWLFTGFPWLSSGYAHNTSPIGGFAPLLGVYGLGWLAALCAGALLMLAHRHRKTGIAILVLVMAGGYGLQQITWTHAEGQPISVRLLQGNVPQQEKFSSEFLQRTLDKYHAAITEAPADLIVTPETAITILPQQLPVDYLASLQRYAQDSKSHLLIGIPVADSQTEYYNSAIGITPTAGASFYRYDKHHLVPFGEFIPPGLHWFVAMMAIPLGDQQRGALLQPSFAVKDQRVLPNICYEDLFGEEIAAQLNTPAANQKPATILLNISNLAWFGESIAIPQHLQISQMRTLEMGRPMLRATNTGATAIIDARGQVLQLLPQNTLGTLSAKVQGMAGTTPYIVVGNKLFLLIAALLLASAWWLAKRRGQAANH